MAAVPTQVRQWFGRVTQEPNTNDCGFFCGYVVDLHRRHGRNLQAMHLSRNDVYQARSKFLGKNAIPIGPGRRWILPRAVPRYLEIIGENKGYSVIEPGRTAKGFRQTVEKALARGGSYGVMIARLSGGTSHWVCVLGTMRHKGRQLWVYYDPGGGLNRTPDLCVHAFFVDDFCERMTKYFRIVKVVG